MIFLKDFHDEREEIIKIAYKNMKDWCWINFAIDFSVSLFK